VLLQLATNDSITQPTYTKRKGRKKMLSHLTRAITLGIKKFEIPETVHII
jgi:hypothetical protein